MAAAAEAADRDAELVYFASIGDSEMLRRRVEREGADTDSLIRTLVGEPKQSLFAGLPGVPSSEPTASPRAQISSRGLPKKLRYDDGLTPLMAAAMGGHGGTVRQLLELKAKPDARNLARETALMMAAGGGKERVVQLLLQPGVDANDEQLRAAAPDLKDSHGLTALHKAAHAGHAEACEILLQHGASHAVRARGACSMTTVVSGWVYQRSMCVMAPSKALGGSHRR